MEKLITVCKVGATRGYRTLFYDLSFSVNAGEILELRGENGSGKSTLLRILAGLTRPDSGSIDYSIGDSSSQNPSFYPVHFLGHQDGIKAQESVEAQIVFWTKFFGEDVSKVRPALERVGLWKRRDVPGRGLSAGQRRRLSLARLLVSYRPIWLLDEPLAALDSKGQDIVLEMMEEHTQKGGSVIAAMHGEGFKNARTINICAPSKAEFKANQLLDDLI
ncbi:heme ABC exporter ATP-binding protein CcmA [Hirschia baltica]|uniref:Heme exporter protein CcmA n=1 Tax=Hirschia baltica (strain ATCC 49814 / DSM 5838 / IFAM 1418) TaxID=582402 RepID=C6XKW6_HIRBI|nr:heme ABC exporter ATP-binding protein CcmA [Hirschia baltica]ACT57795.1 heme exporter protein CcmA [Hirschia baltica ATCC 49814]